MTIRSERGFTLIELVITVLVLGILLGFSIPAFYTLSASQQLKGAAENIAGQMRLAREKAIATGVNQPMHFIGDKTYRVEFAGPKVTSSWALPRGIHFGTTMDEWYTMNRDGSCSSSGFVVIRNERGARDTVSVQVSGLVLVR